jgi:hypothetical protein
MQTTRVDELSSYKYEDPEFRSPAVQTNQDRELRFDKHCSRESHNQESPTNHLDGLWSDK